MHVYIYACWYMYNTSGDMEIPFENVKIQTDKYQAVPKKNVHDQDTENTVSCTLQKNKKGFSISKLFLGAMPKLKS